MTTFNDDVLEDREIFMDTDEGAIGATWKSKDDVTTGTFVCRIGESILHGDEQTGSVFEEEVTITVLSDDAVILQIKINDFIELIDINSNVIEYEVINEPVIDSYLAGYSFIDLRREPQTRI